MSEPIPARSRVVIVTGASGGIGRAVAEHLAADGMSVVAHCSGNAATAEEVVSSITAQGGQAISFGGDVADEIAMAELFDTATTGLAASMSLCTRPASCRCRRSRRWTSTRSTASSV